MKKSMLCTLWGALYIICAGLGFIQDPSGILRVVMIAAALLFFVPPVLLLVKFPDRATRRTLAGLSAASLGVTVVLLAANILAAVRGEALGTLLHILLGICSAPMFCSVYWAISLFLWASLLFAALGRKERAV